MKKNSISIVELSTVRKKIPKLQIFEGFEKTKKRKLNISLTYQLIKPKEMIGLKEKNIELYFNFQFFFYDL